MSAYEKEAIFTQLRQYHANEFPVSLSSAPMNTLRDEFAEFEDKIVSMLLGLVNQKLEFVDLSEELEAFQKKANTAFKKNAAPVTETEFFNAKIEQLRLVLEIAKKATFIVKPPRRVAVKPEPVKKS